MKNYEEDYKDKYEMALEGIQEVLSTGEDFIKMSRLQLRLQGIFPELKKSEDERIRKAIIDYFDNANKIGENPMYEYGIHTDKIIAWLKKQGVQKPVKNIVETWKNMRLEVYQQASGNRHEPNYSDDTTKMFSLNDIDEIIEKISEQKSTRNLTSQEEMDIAVEKCFDEQKSADNIEPKPIIEMKSAEESLGVLSKEYNEIVNECLYGESKTVNKVEPKFQNGQWIVWQNKCYKVNYNGCSYELIDQNGLRTSLEYSTVDENAHLWTIADAKDGDVLVAPYIDDIASSEKVFIFKGIRDRKYANDVVEYYCYFANDRFYINEGMRCFMGYVNDYFYPATKKQRDTLMKEMVNAGYTFDFEKKVLNKIEQKIAWSEKDEERLDNAVFACINTYGKDSDSAVWLKTLKQRIGG